MTDIPRLWPHGISPELRHLIETTCTPRQIDVLKLKAHGYGKRRIARILGVSSGAVADRARQAAKRIQAELDRREAA